MNLVNLEDLGKEEPLCWTVIQFDHKSHCKVGQFHVRYGSWSCVVMRSCDDLLCCSVLQLSCRS